MSDVLEFLKAVGARHPGSRCGFRQNICGLEPRLYRSQRNVAGRGVNPGDL